MSLRIASQLTLQSHVLSPKELALEWLRRAWYLDSFTTILHLMHPSQGKRARDLEAGTRTNWLSMSVPRHVNLGRVGTVVICWFVDLVVSLPVLGPGLFGRVCLCPDQETEHGDTRISYFVNLSRASL